MLTTTTVRYLGTPIRQLSILNSSISFLKVAGFDFNKEEFDTVYDDMNDEALLATAGGNVLRSRECVCCKC